MKALYYDPPNCTSLIEWCQANCCKECMEACKQEVDILEFGSGFNFGKAIIKFKNGQLKKVSVNNLTIIEEKTIANE